VRKVPLYVNTTAANSYNQNFWKKTPESFQVRNRFKSSRLILMKSTRGRLGVTLVSSRVTFLDQSDSHIYVPVNLYTHINAYQDPLITVTRDL